jgi:hypothetical protein
MEYLQEMREFGILAVIWFLVLALLYRFLFTTLRELQYTFWSITLILFTFFLSSAYYYNGKSETFALIYLLLVIILIIESYIMSSPVFYPRVQWWEYDFRVRGDIKIDTNLKEGVVEGRLTDLRRNAGCIVLFNELSIGDIFQFETIFLEEKIKFQVEVVSKREPCPGRGISYGVRFIFEEPSEKKIYNRFRRFWKVKSRGRLRRKFKKESIDA